MSTRSLCAAAGIALALTLTGCGGDDATTTAEEATPAATTTAQQPTDGPLTVADAWAKANTDTAAHPMTGVFGSLTNTTDTPVTIVSATNSVSPVTELHETVDEGGAKVMREAEGGFTIEPGQTRQLAPGGDHVMVMGMTAPLEPGQEVTVTLTTEAGDDLEFIAVAKTFEGGAEDYRSGTESPTDMPMSPSSEPSR